MELKILSLRGIEYEGKINSLNIGTTSGEITVLDYHRPLITILKKGTAIIKDVKDKRTELKIDSGFLEVGPDNQVNVLID
ncbi:MAG: hypothetical protein Q7R86_02270 [bacterium]|nr:hypothetical protein [bacterium]